VIPFSDKTRGHGSHTIGALWKKDLAKLLKETESKRGLRAGAQAGEQRIKHRVRFSPADIFMLNEDVI